MESKFYQPDERRAEKVRDLFTTIARRYDLLNDLMSLGLHRRWKRRLVELADGAASVSDASPASRRDGGHYIPCVLDLCCGTGDIARRFSGNVIGADFTMEMLQVATVPPAKSPVRWVQADALGLPFPDKSFDVVSVGYGLRNLADLDAGLREVWRVLRPGGKLLSLDFGKPESPFLRRLYFGYLRTVLPVLGRIFCGDADTHGYILVSLQDYPAQRGIKTLMQQCGYEACGFEEFCGGTMAINFGSKAR